MNTPRIYRPLRVGVLVLLVSACALAQQRDTVTVTPADTIKAPASPSGIDIVVTYTASDSIVYDLGVRRMFMYGKGTIHNKELGLKADRITIDWTQSTLEAMGVKDTADTSGQRFMGKPEMIDGAETYRGFGIEYNFKSRKGRIDLGKTEIEKGYYTGETIKKVDSDVLYVQDGRFTSCDLEHPHYFFGSPTMKVVVKDRIIARPIFLAIDDVPVFALPFGVFPSQRGRRSGLIAPAYGQSTLGRYLLHLGYYWAMSDYTDLSMRADGYTKGSWALYGDFRYALRYLLNGGVSASMKTTVTGEPGDPGYGRQRDFNIYLNHAQQFDPTARLVVDFTFTTGSYYANTTTSYADLLRQNVVSNATFTKWWEGTPNSLTINIRRDQNLHPDTNEVEVSDLLPSVSFSRSQTYPFRSSEGSSSDQKWYELFGYSYSGAFLNRKTTTKLAQGSSIDSRFGAQHHLTPNFTPHVGYFSVSPFFNYTELWYTKSIRRHSIASSTGTDSLITEDVHGFNAVRYYDMGIAVSTKLYGVLQPGIFGIRGIRHQLTPSLRYTFQPDFAQSKYGYYETYKDLAGRDVPYSIFEREVYGGAPAGKRQSIGLDIGNVFEMKTAASDTAQDEHKIQLLNLSAGVSYNFAADSLRFSEIFVNYRTAIGDLLNIGGSASFNLYAFERDATIPSAGRRVNKLLMNSGGGFAQLTNFSISVGTRISGEKTTSKAGPVRTEADSLNDRMRRGYVGIYDTPAPDFSIPWNLDLTLNFSQNQSNPYNKFVSASLIGNLGFNLTENWKFTASSSYDIRTQQFAAPQITVYRDLHCWELNFSWVPLGTNRNYRLEIRLKAPQLQDIKVTRQTSASGLY